ncbi:MAG: transcriptional regulator [Mesorhizobium sp.]|uniref:MucR family transcriptional regulator n=1 Tax=unclassified Mesorhizobium TaxID=325217 RepID=UPI000F74F3DA|nr:MULTISPECIES: MucR family transcriptional regulator [unclassified Mesorhizobium]TGV92921.1 transcriptional regulator [Mesorhizobium sp. M00.F.Ca.ET.158.01.1.1]AZO61968.1 transcriptional regulator [Mesorhizobium sp. M1A.F.Ca.IN.022.06.1.1]RUV26795.1 transcriptional regulator [Mesorhizobium sp. M1A.F.Ca.IN.022.04.1.1]RWG37521.1 MAG: transcriptional regulator [Mesorhizobium sp.]TGQ21593.1 transcriptional regulator [Mesorhizobium sp. M00.F.Ca.ET.217.01.1.1]
MATGTEKDLIVSVAVDIVSAYVSNNSVQVADIPALIRRVYASLEAISAGPVVPERSKASIPLKKSVRPDFIICLEDGKRFKALKRHLRTRYGLTPDQYRAKWGLPSDYPMVAPNYAALRSALAKSARLGRRV